MGHYKDERGVMGGYLRRIKDVIMDMGNGGE